MKNGLTVAFYIYEDLNAGLVKWQIAGAYQVIKKLKYDLDFAIVFTMMIIQLS